MDTIWDFQGVRVILTGASAAQANPHFEGVATKDGRQVEWRAYPTSTGYVITLKEAHGRVYTQNVTATYNVALEVGMFVKHCF